MNTTNHTSPSGEDAANGATSDTGNAEADQIINRLSSSDPEFDDCIDAVAFIRKLVAEHKGPEGFATWKDAALDERHRRLAAEKRLRDTSKELICAVSEQSDQQDAANGAIGDQEGFDQWFETRGVWPRLTYLEIWQASRAALTAEKSLPLSVEQKAALDLAVLNLKTHGDDQLLAAVKPLLEYYESGALTAETVAGQSVDEIRRAVWRKAYSVCLEGVKWTPEPSKEAQFYIKGTCHRLAAEISSRAGLIDGKVAGQEPDNTHINLFRPSTGDVFKALRTDSIDELLQDGWEISSQSQLAQSAEQDEQAAFDAWCKSIPANRSMGPWEIWQAARAASTQSTATQPAQTQVALTDAPVFDAKHVSLKQRGQNIILTLELNGIESAPRYKVMPVNPGVVRAAASGGEA